MFLAWSLKYIAAPSTGVCVASFDIGTADSTAICAAKLMSIIKKITILKL